MKIINNTNIKNNFNLPKTAVALGNFDGIHTGHLTLIDAITEYKKKHPDIKTCVWTFSEHSQNVLKSSFHVHFITTPEEKAEILEEYKIDYLVLQDFNYVRNMTPDSFVDTVLAESLNSSYVVAGYNFRFGRNASGTAEMLETLLSGRNIESKIIPPVIIDDIAVSSSFIRSLISIGDMERVKKFLGRPFSIKFPVIYGKQIGRKIGVPTINQIFPETHIIPAPGIYVCTCIINGITYRAVTNIGTRPTVNGEFLNSETHIIGFDGDLYGENIKVNFHKKFRDEIRFGNLEELQTQIRKDIEYAKKCVI